jgi:hypothetical protein
MVHLVFQVPLQPASGLVLSADTGIPDNTMLDTRHRTVSCLIMKSTNFMILLQQAGPQTLPQYAVIISGKIYTRSIPEKT